MQFCNSKEVKARMDKTDGVHNAMIRQIISGYSSMFEKLTGREFEKKERTENYDGGRRSYFVNARPIDLTEDVVVTIDAWEATKDSDYFIKPEYGLIKMLVEATDFEPLTVKITYTGGYPTAEENISPDGEGDETETVILVPDEIRSAVIMQSVATFKRRLDPGAQMVNLGGSGGQLTVASPADLLPEFKKVVQMHEFKMWGG